MATSTAVTDVGFLTEIRTISRLKRNRNFYLQHFGPGSRSGLGNRQVTATLDRLLMSCFR